MVEFLYLNGFVILLLVLYMAFWRPKRQPTQLKFRRTGAKNDLTASGEGSVGGGATFAGFNSVKNDGSSGYRDANSSRTTGYHDANSGNSSGSRERQLNVIFQYNGHDFDAYEVLGIPAGSSRDNAEAAYEKTIREVDKESRSFFHCAIEAIRKS